jgi:L-aminopeptidase/D-esterase-like protein
VGAIVAVNALGDVVDPRTGRILAGARSESGFADSVSLLLTAPVQGPVWGGARAGESTTIAVVVTSSRVGREAVTKMAQLAHDGLARAVRPCHLLQDGDTVFAAATGSGPEEDVNVLGVAAAEALSEAVVRAVMLATGLAGVPAARELPWWLEGATDPSH